MLDLDPAAHLLISPPRNHVSPHTKPGSVYFNHFFHVDSRVFLLKKNKKFESDYWSLDMTYSICANDDNTYTVTAETEVITHTNDITIIILLIAGILKLRSC